MSEEINKEEEVVEEATEQAAAEPAAKKKKWPIVVGIVVAVLVVAGIGMWTWHEQPSFCNAFCHTPMDTYVATYDATPDSAATDKWGNEVSNSDAMLAVVHKQAGLNCLSCHVPALSQQVSEVGEEVTGNYYYPLEERSLQDLVTNSGSTASADSFCLRSGCHDMTRQDLTNATSDMSFNPHRWQHGEIACSECHKSHRASVFYCTQCHSEAASSMPDGWVTYSQGQKIASSAS
jgi:flagellar basal body-associated protein FliL